MKDYGRNNSEHISVGNWMVTLIFWFIPGFLLPGIILVGGAAYCIFVLGNWAIAAALLAFPVLCLFTGFFYLLSRKKSKRNFVLAVVIWWLIFAILCGGAYLILKFAFAETYDSLINTIKEFIELIKGSGTESFLLPR